MEITDFGQIAIYNEIFGDVSDVTPKYDPQECINLGKSYSVMHNKKEIPIMIGSNLHIHTQVNPLNISGYFIVDGICKSINNIKVMYKFRYSKDKAKLSDNSEIEIKDMFSILHDNKKFKLPTNWKNIATNETLYNFLETIVDVEGISTKRMNEVDIIIMRYLFQSWLGLRKTPYKYRIMTAGELINISKNPIKYMKSNTWLIWKNTYNCISEDMKHNNIIGDIEAIRKVTILKDRENANLETRNTKNEDKYIFSPIHTPDGKLCGTVRFLCVGVKLKLKPKIEINLNVENKYVFINNKYEGKLNVIGGIKDGELYHLFSYYGEIEHENKSYSYTETFIPYRLHNPPIRTLFACSMIKQAICGNYRKLNDTKTLVNTTDIGFELEVAIMPWYGYNVEDGIVISEKVAKLYTYKELKIYKETSKILSLNIKKNMKVVPNQLLYKKYEPEKVKTITLVYSEIEGIVTSIVKKENYLEVIVECLRKLEVGDKMTSRHGQKSIISLILSEEKMPYYLVDDKKIVIDLLINPHAFPSRMTMGQIKEMGEKLEIVYLPENKKIKTEILVGKCLYMALKHQVHQKMQFRNKGKYDTITKQPLAGRKVGGGLRVGQMEKEVLMAIGAMDILKWLWRSDSNQFYIICLSYIKALGYNIVVHKPNKYSIIPLDIKTLPETNTLNFGDTDPLDLRRIEDIPILPICLRSEKLELLYKRYDKIKIEKEVKILLRSKKGAYHTYFEGHRIDQCIRSVIVPNPELPINTVEIPYGVNIECEYGLLNRQPTLNVKSMAVVKLKIGGNKTIGINPLLCKSFNADFDGDEMNIYGLDKFYDVLNVEPVNTQDYILGDLKKVTETGLTADRKGIIKMIRDGSKGDKSNYEHIYIRIGKLVINGKSSKIIEGNYYEGLTEDEWYECCKAAIESASSISINTPITGYLASMCNQPYL